MAKITVIIKGKKTVSVENLDLHNNSLNDLLSRVKKKAGDFSVNLITIGGENITDFNQKLDAIGLEDEDVFTISDYYNGGNSIFIN
jgi:ABC-type glycerol-3-phosphate transport system substrate-binding protein